MSFIPVNRPMITQNDVAAVTSSISEGWISSDGPIVSEFEIKMAIEFGRKHAIAVSNGTFAIDVVIESLDLKSGDEVILPTLTIISCVSQILRTGAKPIFIDCDSRTFNVNSTDVINSITKKTKLIVLANIYGLMVDFDPILDVAAQNDIYVLEDAAQSIGARYKDKKSCSLGHFSTISMFANKNITTGEGGMIFTDSDYFNDKFRNLRNLCFVKDKRFHHNAIGWNGRITSLQAALGISQLANLSNALKRRQEIANLYNIQINNNLPITKPLTHTDYCYNSYWVYALVIKFRKFSGAHDFIKYLESNNIGARPFFYPLHLQPVMQKYNLTYNSLPNSEKLYQQGLYIPCGLGNTNHEICKVAEFLNKCEF
jgi:perosamine synthetase